MHRITSKSIDQTLAEQLQINERELEQRKALLDFSDEEVNLLLAHKPFIAKRVDEIVKRFYERQIEVPEIALLIGDAETLRRLQAAMRRYILELFDGYYDNDYVNRRLRIGKVHQRIGVSPKLYISAIWLLQTILHEEVDQHVIADKEGESSQVLKQALNKLLMLDTQFVFDTYIASLLNQIGIAKDELEHHVTSLEDTVARRTRQLEELSRKDALTGLYNQRAFQEYLRRELAQAERHGDELSLAYFDLNGFKELNDKEGHLAGDELLTHFGRLVVQVTREADIPCRYGGDEFAVIFPRTPMAAARVTAERLREVLEKSEFKSVMFSMGIVTTGPEHYLDSERLIGEADTLMYRAKEKSRKRSGTYIETREFGTQG